MQTIGMAEFRTASNGGLVLQQFRLTEILADPAAESTRLGQVGIALNEMKEALKVKGGTAGYAISAQSVFTRFVKVAMVGEEKIEQMIRFEAQQNVPFPIDEVVWDYQLVGSQNGGQVEAVLVAIKSDMLEDLNGVVEGAGFQTGTVDIAPMALYNAFRYNYSDMSGCSLLVDVGARTTNLIFIEPGKVFSRTIPIGGTTVTQAIAKDFDEPFQISEDRKKRDGFVGLGGSYAEPDDPEKARLSKVIRNSMTRLHAEIARSISFYRAQQHGAQPVRAFLCGGGVAMPYTREFFAEKLNIAIEFFNPLRNVAVGSGVNPEDAGRSAHVLGELVGLGLRAVTECPMALSLEPESVKRAKAMRRKTPFLATAAVCVVAAIGATYAYLDRAAAITAEAVTAMEPEIAKLGGVKAKFDAVRRELKAAEGRANPAIGAVADRDYWVRVLDEINARLPRKYVWVTVFEPGYFSGAQFSPIPVKAGESTPAASIGAPAPAQQGGPLGASGGDRGPVFGVKLRGLYLYNPREAAVVDDFVEALKQSPLVAEVESPARSAQNEGAWAFPFELNVKLRNAIGTP